MDIVKANQRVKMRVTHIYGLNPVDFSIFHPIKTATQNYLQTNSLNWSDSPCDLRDPLIFYFPMPLNDLFDDIVHQIPAYRLY
jgi:hypothetical protein